MSLTAEQERQVANVSAHLFFPLEQRLGYHKPEDGADKSQVLLWWAGQLGDYAAENLLWFCDYWLRHDEWGKFPRSPAVVEKVLREHGKAGRLALTGPGDALDRPRQEFHAWYMQNVSQHQAEKPFWWRKALEWRLEAEAKKWVDANRMLYEGEAKMPVRGDTIKLEVAGPLMWQAGALPGGITRELAADYKRYQAQGAEMMAKPDELSRGIGRLWVATWESERRAYAAMVTKKAQG